MKKKNDEITEEDMTRAIKEMSDILNDKKPFTEKPFKMLDKWAA
jgi:hypothetical protein